MKRALAALQGLAEEEQARVIGWLVSKLKLGPSAGQGLAAQPANLTAQAGGSPSPQAVPPTSSPATLSPKIFMASKKPQSSPERVACLAYYLTKYRNVAMFKTVDISKLNGE